MCIQFRKKGLASLTLPILSTPCWRKREMLCWIYRWSILSDTVLPSIASALINFWRMQTSPFIAASLTQLPTSPLHMSSDSSIVLSHTLWSNAWTSSTLKDVPRDHEQMLPSQTTIRVNALALSIFKLSSRIMNECWLLDIFLVYFSYIESRIRLNQDISSQKANSNCHNLIAFVLNANLP